MSIKRLKGSSGHVAENAPKEGDAKDKVVRSAIIVHTGPEKQGLKFMSSDGETKPFDEARIKRIIAVHNAKVETLVNEYGGWDKTPEGAFPPLLDSHTDDENDRVIGRLTKLLRFEVRDVPKVGKNVACATTEITFLGEETVKKVNDGRIYHLSIGIDEKIDSLGELSTVIEPAAPGAMLLNGKIKGGTKTLSKGDKQMAKKKTDLKRMQRHTERMSRLSAISADFTKLTASAVETKELAKLSVRQRDVNSRLTKLMSDMKMTPVEYKKLDITRLAKMPDEDVNMILTAYESRTKIEGQQAGSTDAVDFSDIGKGLEKDQWKRMKAEIKGDFKKLGAKVKDDGDTHEMKEKGMSGPKEKEVSTGKDPHSVGGQAGDEQQLSKHMEAMKSHLEKGDITGAKKEHAEMSKCVEGYSKKMAGAPAAGDVKSEDEKKSLEALQGQLDEVHTNMARLAGMVSELMTAEKEEGHDLESGEDDEQKEDKEKEDKTGEKAS